MSSLNKPNLKKGIFSCVSLKLFVKYRLTKFENFSVGRHCIKRDFEMIFEKVGEWYMCIALMCTIIKYFTKQRGGFS